MASEKKSRLKKIQNQAQAILDELRLIAHGDLQNTRLHKFIHFWILVTRSFVANRCPVRASALSYSTLLALIPMLAVAMSVTSSLLKKEGEGRIEQFVGKVIDSVMPPAVSTNAPSAGKVFHAVISSATNQTDATAGTTNLNSSATPTNFVADTNQLALPTAMPGETNAPTASESTRVVLAQKEAAKYIHEFIQKTRSGTLGIVGMVMLVFVAISMLSRIEDTFNDIWGVTRGRNWLVRIVLYWTTITLGPLLLAAALGLSSGSYLQITKDLVNKMPFVGSLFFQFLPIFVLWLTFTLLYLLVPNTKVHFGAAFIGGMVGGSLWHLNNVFGFLYVSRVVTNSKIYGSLGLIPVFMAGLYFSWLILLFGAQVAYAFQNRKSYLQNKLMENVNQRGREFIALRLMTCIGQRFQLGLPPVTLQQISIELGIPSRLAQQVMQTLLGMRLVTEIAGAEPAYAPSRPLEAVTVHHILLAMRVGQGQDLVSHDETMRAEVYGEFARIEEAERQAASSVTLLNLVNRVQAHLEIAAPQLPLAEKVLQKTEVVRTEEKPLPKAETAEPIPAPEPEEKIVAADPVKIKTEFVEPSASTPAPATEPRNSAGVVPEDNHDFPL